ncbi:MAG TPA: class I SAM-dependent methyltransferase [Acidimicrobiales bacterium]
MLHEDRLRAGSFGEDAEQYDRSRPRYPAALVDRLLSDGARRVLDVGAGTGIVSALFAERGCDVLGVEPDDRMGALARRRGIEIEEATFEDWEDRGRRFDLVVSGQAWHWVDPVRGAAKAASVLHPGGRVGVFWNQGVHRQPLRDALVGSYRRAAPELADHSIVLGFVEGDRVEVAASAIDGNGWFERAEVRDFWWSTRYSTEQWLDQLPTHSDHRTLPPPVLERLVRDVGRTLDGAGGSFEMDYRTWLVTARRTPA